MKLRRSFALAAAMSAVAGFVHAQGTPQKAAHGWNARRFDQVLEVACHNCYDSARFGRFFPEALGYVQNVEIDFYPRRVVDGSIGWPVSHDAKDANHNNCGSRGSAGLDLAGCLRVLAAAYDVGKDPRPLTVFLDSKKSLGNAKEMAALDSLVRAAFSDRLYIPDYLRVPSDKSLAAAVASRGWPSRDSLAGRVLVVLTGGFLEAGPEGNKALSHYAERLGKDAAMFIAPALADSFDVRLRPKGLTRDLAGWVVFGNVSDGEGIEDVFTALEPRHWVGRLWGADGRIPGRDPSLCRVLGRRAARVAFYSFWKSPWNAPCGLRPD